MAPPKKALRLKDKPQADPVIDPSAIPPALPPSVEEAYRRKCIQLKQRTNEVEEENDATRLRLARIRRQIEKMRVERAFLLEQLTRRTSANVEDSEGSPSPPPTPQDKPLRTKRGHRKPSILADIDGGANKESKSARGASPTSEAAFSTQASAKAKANGLIPPKPPKKLADAFELYCEDARPALLKARGDKAGEDTQGDGEADTQTAEGELTVDDELQRSWRDLPEREREQYETKFNEVTDRYEKEMKAYESAKKKAIEEEEEKEKEAEKEKETEKEKEKEKEEEEEKGEEEKEGEGADNTTTKGGDPDIPKESSREADDNKEEDTEMKDDADDKTDAEVKSDQKKDKHTDDKEESEAAAESDSKSRDRTKLAHQDEDVEMGDDDAATQAEEKTGDKSDSKADD